MPEHDPLLCLSILFAINYYFTISPSIDSILSRVTWQYILRSYMKNDGEKSLHGRERVKSGRCSWIFMMRTRNFFYFLLLERMRVHDYQTKKPKRSNLPMLVYAYSHRHKLQHMSEPPSRAMLFSFFPTLHMYINLTSRLRARCSSNNNGRFRGYFISFREFLAFLRPAHLSLRLRSSRFSTRAR